MHWTNVSRNSLKNLRKCLATNKLRCYCQYIWNLNKLPKCIIQLHFNVPTKQHQKRATVERQHGMSNMLNTLNTVNTGDVECPFAFAFFSIGFGFGVSWLFDCWLGPFDSVWFGLAVGCRLMANKCKCAFYDACRSACKTTTPSWETRTKIFATNVASWWQLLSLLIRTVNLMQQSLAA